MIKKKFAIAAIVVSSIVLLTSCSSTTPYMVIPQAVNTINSVGLDELNLKHNTDYTILNTATAEAAVIFTVNRKGVRITIREENNEFEIVYLYDAKNGKWYIYNYEGIARFGFLTNDYGRTSFDRISPEDIVRNLAIYRLINASKVRGADGVIEPVISTNVEQRGNDIVFRTTASAKLIKLNVDSK